MDTNSNWARNEKRGNYSLLMGSMLFVVVGFGALSVDVSLMTMAELQVQATADAASHAALIAFRENNNTSEGNSAAGFILAQNDVAMGTAVMRAGYPQYGQFDFDFRTFAPGLTPQGTANAVRVQIARDGANSVDLLLAPLLGVNTHDVDGTSITAQQKRGIMLVQDMSCSMMGTSTSAAVNISRQANQVFIDYLNTRPQAGDMLGLAMFAQRGSRKLTSDPLWGIGTSNINDPPWMPLQAIASNYGGMKTLIDGICNTSSGQPCPAALGGAYHPRNTDIGSCTNPRIAIDQARVQLANNTDPEYFRAIVLMSDGIPNCETFGWTSTAAAQNAAITAVNLAYSSFDISVYPITFHNGSFDPAFMNGLKRGLGFSQVSPNAADLPAMFQQVAKSLPTALVD